MELLNSKNFFFFKKKIKGLCGFQHYESVFQDCDNGDPGVNIGCGWN